MLESNNIIWLVHMNHYHNNIILTDNIICMELTEEIKTTNYLYKWLNARTKRICIIITNILSILKSMWWCQYIINNINNNSTFHNIKWTLTLAMESLHILTLKARIVMLQIIWLDHVRFSNSNNNNKISTSIRLIVLVLKRERI